MYVTARSSWARKRERDGGGARWGRGQVGAPGDVTRVRGGAPDIAPSREAVAANQRAPHQPK